MELTTDNMYEYVLTEMVPDLYIGGCEVGYKGVFYVEYGDFDSEDRFYMTVREWLTTDGLLDDLLESDEVSEEQASDLAARVEAVIRLEYATYLRNQLDLLTGENND